MQGLPRPRVTRPARWRIRGPRNTPSTMEDSRASEWRSAASRHASGAGGASSMRARAPAIAASSCGSTIAPATPSGTTSRSPPIAVPTTGRPLASASSAATPRGSTRLTCATTSDAVIHSATPASASTPVRMTCPAIPSRVACASIVAARGPSPTNASSASGWSAARMRAKARRSPPGFFRSVRPPTASTTGTPGARPSRARAASRGRTVNRWSSTPMLAMRGCRGGRPSSRIRPASHSLTQMTAAAPRTPGADDGRGAAHAGR